MALVAKWTNLELVVEWCRHSLSGNSLSTVEHIGIYWSYLAVVPSIKCCRGKGSEPLVMAHGGVSARIRSTDDFIRTGTCSKKDHWERQELSTSRKFTMWNKIIFKASHTSRCDVQLLLHPPWALRYACKENYPPSPHPIVLVLAFACRFTGLVKTLPIPPVNGFFNRSERLEPMMTEIGEESMQDDLVIIYSRKMDGM